MYNAWRASTVGLAKNCKDAIGGLDTITHFGIGILIVRESILCGMILGSFAS